MNSSGPAVLRFRARLGPTVDVPMAIGKQLRGMERVEGTINGHPFRAPLEHDGAGRCALRANQAMLKGARAKVGGTVNLAILGPEPKLQVPADLRAALRASDEATAMWKDLPDACRRDYVRWIDGTKVPETRARRVRRSVEQLAEGKRRPCCVNFYEYMLRRIEED